MSGSFISRNLATRDACHEFHEAAAVEYLMLWNFYGDACLVVCGWSATQTDPVSAFSEHELLVGVCQPVFRFRRQEQHCKYSRRRVCFTAQVVVLLRAGQKIGERIAVVEWRLDACLQLDLDVDFRSGFRHSEMAPNQ